MAKLVQKCSYIKPGGNGAAGAGGYMRYIATRDGVVSLHGRGPVTAAQRSLISDLLRDFPDSRELFEYADYELHPSLEKASSFISAALDTNVESIQPEDGYMKYIATRPRVEKQGDHGLFSAASNVDLDAAISELEARTGNVWTVIYSLRREDAARLGYDTADSWRDLLIRHQQVLADASRIQSKDLKWYAAFHDEGTHPHIHLMFWSAGENDGYLSNEGVQKMRSVMTNDIFQNEMTELYQRKDRSYKEVSETAKLRMSELVAHMRNQLGTSPVIEQRMVELAQQLETVTGKKQYAYLKKPLKKLVDELVDELAKEPSVAQCYAAWNEIRDELEGYYKTTQREHLPLSQQKEFRTIKNLVIREADNLRTGVLTYEEDWSEGRYADLGYPEYRAAKLQLQTAKTQEEIQSAISKITEAAELGSDRAQYTLGKMYLLGQAVEQDHAVGTYWLRQSAEQGNTYAQQVLSQSHSPKQVPVLLSTLRLFHNVSKIFQERTLPKDSHKFMQIDSKRRQELAQKRLASGQRIDDHDDSGLQMG